jgi:cytohesin
MLFDLSSHQKGERMRNHLPLLRTKGLLIVLTLGLLSLAASATPLHDAVASGDTTLAKRLLDHGADPNARDEENETPLHDAAEKGNVEMVLLLLQEGARAGRSGSEGETPLHEATEAGYLEVVRELVRHGAPLNTADNKGFTALHLAIIEGHEEIALYLISAGSSLGALTANLQSPLQLARQKNQASVAKAIEDRL